MRHITYRYDAWGRLYQQPVSRYLMLSKDADTTKPTSPRPKNRGKSMISTVLCVMRCNTCEKKYTVGNDAPFG